MDTRASRRRPPRGSTCPLWKRISLAERAHLDASRKALRLMRERAEDLFAAGDTVAGDTYAAETLGKTLSRRILEFADNPDTPLFFGKLPIEQDRFHDGRRHVTDAAGEPMVVDC